MLDGAEHIWRFQRVLFKLAPEEEKRTRVYSGMSRAHVVALSFDRRGRGPRTAMDVVTLEKDMKSRFCGLHFFIFLLIVFFSWRWLLFVD